MPAMKNLATTRRRTGVLPFVAIASATLAACASAPAHRWVSGICDASVALDADIISSIDIKPVQTGGSLINVEINTEDGEHRRGFGCNLLPPTFRNQFKGPDLADNASSDIRKQGYKVVADTTRPVRGLDERRLRLAKEGEQDIHLLYRWPEDKAFLNRAFLFPSGKTDPPDVGDFFDSFREGWGDYTPWQRVGIGECDARYAFPAKPACRHVIGLDHVVVACTAEVPGAPKVRVATKCMVQKLNADQGEGTALNLLDRGLALARSTTTGVTTAPAMLLMEAGRTTPTDVWTRARRHTLRSEDGARQREALVAVDGVVVHALWVETEGREAPPPDLVARFFKAFSK
jgi:hypothetical protein